MAVDFCRNLKLVKFGVSVGGVESLVQIPAKMSHRDVNKDLLEKLGINEMLIRLSVGIENINDLIQDLQQAFAAVFPEEK
jgi:cystathionine beta-lyase/cystathionine gamma-synthase